MHHLFRAIILISVIGMSLPGSLQAVFDLRIIGGSNNSNTVRNDTSVDLVVQIRYFVDSGISNDTGFRGWKTEKPTISPHETYSFKTHNYNEPPPLVTIIVYNKDKVQLLEGQYNGRINMGYAIKVSPEGRYSVSLY